MWLSWTDPVMLTTSNFMFNGMFIWRVENNSYGFKNYLRCFFLFLAFLFGTITYQIQSDVTFYDISIQFFKTFSTDPFNERMNNVTKPLKSAGSMLEKHVNASCVVWLMNWNVNHNWIECDGPVFTARRVLAYFSTNYGGFAMLQLLRVAAQPAIKSLMMNK